MKHDKPEITVPKPCAAPWDEMHDRGDRRLCDHCDTDVYDLSLLTREEAHALVENGGEHLCVRYAHADGEVFFKDSTSPVWRLSRQLEGAKKLLAAAALIVPMLAACDPAQPEPEATPEAVTPIAIDAGGASLKPGAGIAPGFDEPTAPAEADPDLPEKVGKVAAPEVVEVEKSPPTKEKDETEPIVAPKDPERNIVVGKPAIRDPRETTPIRPGNIKGKPAFRVGKPAPRLDPDKNDTF